MENIEFKPVYESKLQRIYFSKSHNLLKNVWTSKTNYWELKDLQKEMFQWMEQFDKFKPEFLITNNQETDHVLTPEMQDWMIDFLYPKIPNTGVTKWAITINPAIFTQVSVEMVLEERKKIGDYELRYFQSPTKTFEWLLG